MRVFSRYGRLYYMLVQAHCRYLVALYLLYCGGLSTVQYVQSSGTTAATYDYLGDANFKLSLPST